MFLSQLFPVPQKILEVPVNIYIYYIFLLLAYYGVQNSCCHWTGGKMRRSRSNFNDFDDEND